MRERSPRQQGIVLENREVVALVVGSLVVLGVVFYLGVSVGKGLAPEPPLADRSLEALDRQAEESMAMELTFAQKLTEEAEAARAEEVALQEAEPAEREPEAEPAAPEPAEAEPVKQPSAATESAEAATPARPEPAAEPAAERKPAAQQPRGESRFAVQLASFPSREEADTFAGRLRGVGLSPRVIAAEIPEKGTYYRVRVGSFGSRDEAGRFLDDLRREGRFDGIVMPMDG